MIRPQHFHCMYTHLSIQPYLVNAINSILFFSIVFILVICYSYLRIFGFGIYGWEKSFTSTKLWSKLYRFTFYIISHFSTVFRFSFMKGKICSSLPLYYLIGKKFIGITYVSHCFKEILIWNFSFANSLLIWWWCGNFDILFKFRAKITGTKLELVLPPSDFTI